MTIYEFIGEHPWLTLALVYLVCATVESVAKIVASALRRRADR